MSLLVFGDIEGQYAKDAQLNPDDVGRLEEWQRHQPHLPAPLHPIETAMFLQVCRYSTELAKQRMDTFFTFRSHCPEFFAQRDPFAPHLQMAMKTVMVTVLPDLTPEGFWVSYTRLLDTNVEVFDMEAVVKASQMVSDLEMMQHGYRPGYLIVCDLERVSLAHLLKVNLLSMKNLLTYSQTVVPLHLISIHFVNGVSFMDKILLLFRPFLSKQLQNSTHVHFGDNATIFKHVPKEILPIECGGSRFCATDYYKNHTRRNVELNSEYFKLVEQRVVDESKRPGKPKGAADLFGVEGTFKQLRID